MGATTTRTFAIDSNFLIDLADRRHVAEEARGGLIEKGAALCVPPTVLVELAYMVEHGAPHQQESSTIALQSLRQWDIHPFVMKPVGNYITHNFSDYIRTENIIPFAECNDGLILAESSLGGAPILVTSDRHLLDADKDRLALAFAHLDLDPVMPIHPKGILRFTQ